jgi:hypothetical protein
MTYFNALSSFMLMLLLVCLYRSFMTAFFRKGKEDVLADVAFTGITVLAIQLLHPMGFLEYNYYYFVAYGAVHVMIALTWLFRSKNGLTYNAPLSFVLFMMGMMLIQIAHMRGVN